MEGHIFPAWRRAIDLLIGEARLFLSNSLESALAI